MKLTKDDITILKNFAQINPGIELRAGKILQTIHEHQVLFAEAALSQEVPSNFAIYNLNNFLSIYSMFGDPTLEFSGDVLTFKEGTRKASYRAAERSMLTLPPDKEIKYPETIAQFSLTAKDFSSIKDFARIYDYSTVLIRNVDGLIQVQVKDIKNPSSDSLDIKTESETDIPMNVIMKINNLTLLDGAYEVEISSRMSLFKNKDKPVKYWVSIEKNSTIG
jgi:hypothetical protein